MADQRVTVNEAAGILRVCPRQVRYLKDRIGYEWVGPVLTFSRRAVEKFAAANGYPCPARSRRPGKKGEE